MGVLRLLLALSVVFGHSVPFVLTGTNLVGGRVAVEAFFMISGFYMALVLESKYAGDRRAFYWNRFLRLFPTYWVVLLCAVVLGFLISPENRFSALLATQPALDTLALMLVANVLIFGSDVMMFLSADAHGLFFVRNFQEHALQLHAFHYLPQAWSLPLELMFYMIAPLLVGRVRLIAALIVASVLVKALTFHAFGMVDPWAYRFFPSELSLFCIGFLACRMRLVLPRYLSAARIRRLGTVAFAAVATLTVFYETIPLREAFKTPGYLLLLACALPVLFERFRESRMDRFVGDLSYPVYLCHTLVIACVRHFGLTLWGEQSLLIVGLTLIFSIILLVAVTNPVEHRFKRVPRSVRLPAAAAAPAGAAGSAQERLPAAG